MNRIKEELTRKNIDIYEELKKLGKSTYIGSYKTIINNDDLLASNLKLETVLLFSKILGIDIYDLLYSYEKDLTISNIDTFNCYYNKLLKKAKEIKKGEFQLTKNLERLKFKNKSKNQKPVVKTHSQQYEDEKNGLILDYYQNNYEEPLEIYLDDHLSKSFPAEHKYGLRIDDEGKVINGPDCSEEIKEKFKDGEILGNLPSTFVAPCFNGSSPTLIRLIDNGIRKDIIIAFSGYNNHDEFINTSIYGATCIDTDDEKKLSYFKCRLDEPFDPDNIDIYTNRQEITSGDFYESLYKHIGKFKINR